jgi:hypothetical protein
VSQDRLDRRDPYTPNYAADTLRLLFEAGYEDDPRIRRGMEWLPDMRQSDGGWTVPTRTVGDAPLGEVVAHDDWVTFAAARVFERFVGRAR